MVNNRIECKERHVLVVNDRQRRAIALEAAAYSVGRDPSNAIVLDVDTISRQHAILLRVPIPGKHEYRYRVIDGNFEGKASANGVFVNEKKISNRDLANGDVIRFGQSIEASYLIVSMGDVEFGQYLEGISYQSLKSEMVNAKETLVASFDMEDELTTFLEMEDSASTNQTISKATLSPTSKATLSSTSKATVPLPLAETLHEDVGSKDRSSLVWKAVLPGIVLLVAGVAGVWTLLSQSHPQQSSAETRSPATDKQPVAPQ